MDITDVIITALELLVTIIIVFAVPKIKANVDLKSALLWVDIAVEAAEQLYYQTEGEKKKAYVMKFLLDHGVVLDEDELDTAIEAAVHRLHKELED